MNHCTQGRNPYDPSFFIPRTIWHVPSLLLKENRLIVKKTYSGNLRWILKGSKSDGFSKGVLTTFQASRTHTLSDFPLVIIPHAGLSLLQTAGCFPWLAGLVPWKHVPRAGSCQCCQGTLFPPAPERQPGVWTRLALMSPWSDFAEMSLDSWNHVISSRNQSSVSLFSMF